MVRRSFIVISALPPGMRKKRATSGNFFGNSEDFVSRLRRLRIVGRGAGEDNGGRRMDDRGWSIEDGAGENEMSEMVEQVSNLLVRCCAVSLALGPAGKIDCTVGLKSHLR